MRASPDATLSRIYQVLDQVTSLPALPRHLRDEIDRELLPSLYARLLQGVAHEATPCAFWPAPEPGAWCIGNPERPRRVMGGRAQAALHAAWRAIAEERPACREVSSAKDAERDTRRMIRQTAPAWAARHCPELAVAFGRILILDGKLQYTEGGAVRVRFASGVV